MFDAKRLLGDFIAGQVQRKLGGGGYRGGYSPGHHGHHAGAFGDLGRSLGGGGALAGGLASLILGSKKGRKLGGSALKLGGLALVGSLAYRAFQDWQASQRQTGAPAGAAPARGSFLGSAGASPWGAASPSPAVPTGAGGPPEPFPEPPPGSPFAPAAETEQQNLSRALLRAMIAAAKADGHIDAKEQALIFAEMDRLDLDSDDKAFVVDELRAPLDVEAVARSARNAEEASAIYAASLLAIDVDNPAERGYLALLAARLKLDEGLVKSLHASVERATVPA